MFSKGFGEKKNILKELVSEPIESKSKYLNLKKNFIRQSEQLIDDTLKGKENIDKEKLFKISLSSFLKAAKQRDNKDIAMISLYLVQMKKFMKLFGDDFISIKDTDYYEQLKKISSTILYQKFNKNRIVVKFGDEGKKFFLILKGEVQVILPTKKNVILQQREFKRYLLLLYIYKEYEILKLVIKDNKLNQNQNRMFNASYYFFPDENLNTTSLNQNSNNNTNNNNNTSNYSNKEEENNDKNNYYYGYKDYKFGFNKIENRKSISNNNINNENNNEKGFRFKEMGKMKFIKKLMKYYLTEDEIAYYEKTKNINLKETDDGIKITPIEYINRINDYSNPNIYKIYDENAPDSELFINDDLRGSYFIYEYKRLIELQTGDIFGDLALTGNNIKRTATITSVDECHFACLTRELYSAFIEKGNERIRNNKINYLCSINILKSFPKFILDKKLFNHFGFKNFIKDKYILKTNEINNDIIFLKDGVFEVSFNGKLNDLSDLINLYYREYLILANKKEREELDENLINNIKLMEYQKYKIESIFQKEIKEEFSYVLFLVNAPSVFGFRETEKKYSKIIINKKKKTEEKKYFYYSNICVKCQSSKGEYIYIDKNIFYKQIYGTDSLVQEETKSYVLDYLRKFMKRLLNIRYIKLWNLFLSLGIDKTFNPNINLEKMQQSEDIYKTVNKLLYVLKEGQIYSNEISKYMNNYFEDLRKITQKQKQQIKLVNQNYKTDKLKKLVELKQNNDYKIDKNIEYKTNRNNINYRNLFYNINTSSSIKRENEKNTDNNNNKLIQQKKLNQSLLNYRNIKIKNANKRRSRSCGTDTDTDTYTNPNRQMIKKKSTKNVNKKNWFLRQSLKSSFLKRASSTSNSGFFNKNKKLILRNSSTPRLNNISKLENNKYNELSLMKFNKNNSKNYFFSTNRPNTSKFACFDNYFNYSKVSKEKYVRERINYIIKNTRMLFTKTKNLDKIVRIKRVNSAV